MSSISAADGSLTLRGLADPATGWDAFGRHVFPLRGVNCSVLQRRDHTEAAVELARAAGLQTDDEWSRVGPLIPPAERRGNKRAVDLCEVFNGCLLFQEVGDQTKALVHGRIGFQEIVASRNEAIRSRGQS